MNWFGLCCSKRQTPVSEELEDLRSTLQQPMTHRETLLNYKTFKSTMDNRPTTTKQLTLD